MALDKEKMAKVLQTIQARGVNPQVSEDTVEVIGPEGKRDLKTKMKRRRKKIKGPGIKNEIDFPEDEDEELDLPSNVTGSF